MKGMPKTISAALLCAALIAPGAHAQSTSSDSGGYPNRPIKLLVGFAAGGSVDNAARAIAKELGKDGWTVVVENKTGASGMIATRELARSEPDGYTLMVGSVGNLAMVPDAMKNPGVNVLKDLTPIAQLGSAPLLLVANRDFPAKNLADVIKLAKKRKGGLDYASGGVATPPNLAGELFATAAGISLNHIAYRGEAPALLDVMGGHVPMMFANFTAAYPQIKGEKVTAIAVTSAERSPALPDVPTVAESGIPNFAVENWYGLVGPAGLPQPLVKLLNEKVVSAMNQPEVKMHFASEGFSVSSMSSDQFAAHMKAELAKWKKVVETRHIKLQ